MEGLVFLSTGGASIWRELAYRRVLTNDQVYIRDMAMYRPDIAHDYLNRYIIYSVNKYYNINLINNIIIYCVLIIASSCILQI